MKRQHSIVAALLGLALFTNLSAAKPPAGQSSLAAPSNLTATAIASDQVRLTWQDNSSNEREFDLERSTDGFKTIVQAKTAANVTQYTDTGLQGGVTYAYRVRARNKTATSAYSNVATVATPQNTGIVIGPWTTVFQGVEHATGLTDVANSPRQVVNALRIDLQAQGIALFSTPRSGNYQPEVEETTGLTTTHAVVKYGLQAAINGNWFTPCCTGVDGAPEDLLGLAISQQVVVSQQEAQDYSTAMTITSANQASMAADWPPFNTDSLYTVVAGKNAVLSQGAYVGTNTLIAPRTALGITQDARYLLLMTIDGRQPGYSDGASDADTAAWMQRFGAFNAFNLDGGGSTAMAISDGNGGALLLNRPIHNDVPGLERAVGNHFGVFAQPLGTTPATLVVRNPEPARSTQEALLFEALAALVDSSPEVTVTPMPAGGQRIKVVGRPDYTYSVEFTESLANPDWQALASGRANELGEFDVIDPMADGPRYYRGIQR